MQGQKYKKNHLNSSFYFKKRAKKIGAIRPIFMYNKEMDCTYYN